MRSYQGLSLPPLLVLSVNQLQLLAEHPGESIPQASQNVFQSQSIYRFWGNQRVKPKQILASHRASVVSRANQQAVVLAIQDTTDLDFSGLKQTTGLGFTCQTPQQGIKVHSCLQSVGQANR